ncbi:MAG: radical SAM protein [Gemmatimonadota bacterium]
MVRSTEDLRIRGLRPSRPRPPLDPFAPPRVLLERERRRGQMERSLTVFLTGAECPFTCVFCDLWRHTLDGPTPPGALPVQLGQALDAPEAGPESCDRIKLYNASNWFDPRAVPRSEFDELGRLVAPFRAVTVESHARTVGPRCQAFADRIGGRLEVAIGLETVHPGALPRLNKGMTLEDFDRAAAWLGEHDMDLRVFALVGAPFIPPEESVAWAVRTAEYALDRGAAIVSLIPVRPGPGELARLAAAGEFTAPSLTQLEDALDRCLRRGMDGVTADLWDANQLVACPACRPARLNRLGAMNLTGVAAPAVSCLTCGGSP